jgi:hypothetical protein
LAGLSIKLAAILSVAALVVSPGVAFARAWLSHNENDVEPRQELALAATQIWREATGRPLAYVGGTHRYDNGVAFYSPDRPHAFVELDYRRSQWITPQKLAEFGLLSVCVRDDADCLSATAALATPQTTHSEITLAHRFFGHAAPPVSFVVTVIPPQ